MKVWITRTRPGAEQTAARLAGVGIDSLIDPVLEVRPTATAIDLEAFDALAFTSPNAVRVFGGLCAERSLPVFAVGDATAEAARLEGFDQVDSAAGDVEALAKILIRASPGRVLHPAPAEPAGDLAALCRPGVEVVSRAIYETVPVPPLTALHARNLNAVLIHSPRAAANVVALAPEGLRDLTVLALSEACAAPFDGVAVKSIRIAPFPDDATLVRLTVETLRMRADD